ncbi:MAG: DMT family transporter [Acidimicrobiia bacterium]|nr:DMT family transporter [Acidimicrobiia bacterium]
MQRLLYNPWLSIIAAAVAWGSGTVLTKAALDSGMTPFSVMLGRYLFALAGLAAVLALGGGLRKPDREATWRGAVLGAVNMALPTIFFTLALEHLSASLGGILIALIPAATVASAHFFVSGERFQAWRLPGLVVAFVGVAVLIGGEEGGPSSNIALGVALSFLGIAGAGVGGALSRRYAIEVSALRLVAPQFAAGAIATAMAAAPAGAFPELAGATPRQWILVALLGILSTTVPFFAFLWVVQIAPAAKAALIGYLVPLAAVIGAIALLGDPVTGALLGGGALIIGGVIIADRGHLIFPGRNRAGSH